MIESFFPPFSSENTELMMEVADSPHGQVLDKQIRYEKYLSLADGVEHRFMTEPEYTETSNRWQNLLGADVNNLQHNPYTALIGKWICMKEKVDSDITERVERMGLVHDLAEAVFDPHNDRGDVSYDEAQKMGIEAFEQEHNELGEILSRDHFSISPDVKDQIVADLNDSKQTNPETTPGRIFAIAEKLGYVMTALNAYDLVNSKNDSVYDLGRDQISRFRWLTENVLANHVADLVGLAESYKSVEEFLWLRSDEIFDVIFCLNGDRTRNEINKYYLQYPDVDIEERERKWSRFIETWVSYDMAA